MFDTCAEGNYINYKISSDELGFKNSYQSRVSIPKKRNSELADTYIFKRLKILTGCISDAEFICLKNLDFDIIIGVEIIQLLGLSLYMSTDKILL